jgi:hypothetical protein
VFDGNHKWVDINAIVKKMEIYHKDKWWKLTVVLDCYGAMETYSRIENRYSLRVLDPVIPAPWFATTKEFSDFRFYKLKVVVEVNYNRDGDQCSELFEKEEFKWVKTDQFRVLVVTKSRFSALQSSWCTDVFTRFVDLFLVKT